MTPRALPVPRWPIWAAPSACPMGSQVISYPKTARRPRRPIGLSDRWQRSWSPTSSLVGEARLADDRASFPSGKPMGERRNARDADCSR